MSDIRGVSGVNPADFSAPSIRRVGRTAPAEHIQDSVEISSASARASEVAAYADLAKAAPDIRAEVVELARKRVESGAYLASDVTAAVARKIAESL
ncbi:MAG: flagellar biosynthesis anti-sigma factor FlgM [Candidatus Omnitrophica bacterium]|nr:hypothetical protein [bacterium]NUN97724.1 flagellar biosynthesis anti-sigma factor FlgM [Candidatus Omnitrophota bacterium]